MKKKKTLIGLLALALVMVVGIGFAIATISLNIEGSVKVTPANFDVQFIAGTGYTVDKTTKDGDTAVISEVTLQNVGDKKTVTLTLANKSVDYTATIGEITAATITNSLSDDELNDDIKITFTKSADSIAAKTDAGDGTITITVEIELLQAQLDEVTFSFEVTFTADAVPVAV